MRIDPDLRQVAPHAGHRREDRDHHQFQFCFPHFNCQGTSALGNPLWGSQIDKTSISGVTGQQAHLVLLV
jgi:hypothetical protein